MTSPANSAVIRTVALGLFRHDGRILVSGPLESATGSPMYRPIGGGIEFGETSEQALRREVQEETGEQIAELSLFRVLENLFMVDGQVAAHEVLFVYDCCFVDESLYQRSRLEITEDDGTRHQAAWRSLDFFDAHTRLVPETLADVLGVG